MQGILSVPGEFAIAHKSFTVCVPAKSWSSAAPFVQTVNVPNMSDDGVPIYDLQKYSREQFKEFAKITELETLSGSIKVTAEEKKPVSDINLRIEVLY